MTVPVVFIHGTNAGPWTMQNFSDRFAARGFDCHSPAYRHHETTLNAQTAERLVGLGIADYAQDIADVITTLDTPPVLVGHSLGGVIAQLLAARGLARAIVLLNSSVTWGTLPTTDKERNLGKMFMSAGPFWDTTLLPDFDTMAEFGLNKLDPADQHRVFDRLGPESGRVMFELFFWIFDTARTTQIDHDAITCPVLMVSGSDDLAIPPSTARQIFDRYADNATFHEATGHGHYLMLEPGWPDLAARCVDWVIDQTRLPR